VVTVGSFIRCIQLRKEDVLLWRQVMLKGCEELTVGELPRLFGCPKLQFTDRVGMDLSRISELRLRQIGAYPCR
jgi:hypothetical protein